MRLVARLNDRWGVFEVNGDLIVHPLSKPYCPMIWDGEICGGELLLHDFSCYEHRYPEGRPELRHCDVHLKCSRCGWHYTFGLAIPLEFLDKLRKSRYHGRTLRMELKEIYPELDEKVIERLRRWGYW